MAEPAAGPSRVVPFREIRPTVETEPEEAPRGVGWAVSGGAAAVPSGPRVGVKLARALFGSARENIPKPIAEMVRE
jgi:hypothetical protein